MRNNRDYIAASGGKREGFIRIDLSFSARLIRTRTDNSNLSLVRKTWQILWRRSPIPQSNALRERWTDNL
jgi:hypothetical protein